MVEQFAVGSGQLASGNMQSAIGNKQSAISNEEFKFKIFTSNKDLDGSFLQGVAVDEWVNYNLHTKVCCSSINNILPVLKQGLKRKPVYYLHFCLNFE